LYDIVIVGAGPVGNRIAFRLAGAGRKVLVVERKDQVNGKPCCTGIVSRECVETYPLCREAVLRAANSATIFTPAGRSLRVEKESATAYILSRAKLDAAMIESAQESGAEYVAGASVQQVAVSSESATVRAHFNGREVDFQGKTAVIASGFGSKLPEGLGSQKCRDFAMGGQAEVDSVGVDGVEVYLGRDVAPGFFGWVVPVSEEKALVGLLSRRRTNYYLKRFLGRLKEQGKITGAEPRIYLGGVPLRPLRQSHSDRVLVVGDAAGQVKPTTGGGIHYGLLCADLAADTLEDAIRRDSFSAVTLARYDREWKKLLGRELLIGHWARSLYERLSDRQIEDLVETAYAKRIHEALMDSPDFSFDWHSRLVIRGLRRFGPRVVLTLLLNRRHDLPE
jgi:digeranylgeranylglycerophospholipid reductase